MKNTYEPSSEGYEVPTLTEVGDFADLTRASSSGDTIDGGATPWIYRNSSYHSHHPNGHN
ncbi:lasso RiPP family leader peptide-containing protein [Streptomyces sp. NPDC059256]|uniref:lasso RiPP family leader peptide-containing protein n=1 Tax=Streptomyces sp. NPDC059256 TaxID=3346794 RepID=UPI0036805820